MQQQIQQMQQQIQQIQQNIPKRETGKTSDYTPKRDL
ncbi:hypothetical protein JL09_g6334 [Pichia kudriavzevii]|uniref:Uncharacterized protein n=2 Tax=Pichia kudriavzevii TaxID=4909 RepID=A0A099NP11_PICKU|nr:hypothetical protein JL09_g6334 [Pichia kudriavzevii]